MEIICTPSNGLLALIIDIDRGRIVREVPLPSEMQAEKVRPFGISPDADDGWYIASNTLVAHLDKELRVQNVLRDLPENIHQLQYDPVTGRLWVVATAIDSLLSIAPDFNTIERFCLLSDEWIAFDAPGSDTQHFNSISWRRGQLRIVAHKFSATDSFVRTYDREMNRQSEWHAGREAHCICEYDGEMLLLDSRGGAIRGDKGTHIQVCESIYYARGMAITPDGHAVIAAFPFGARETRHTGTAFLRVYNLKTRRQLSEIKLPGVGNIQDIQMWNPVVPIR